MKLIVPTEEFVKQCLHLKARYNEARKMWVAAMREVHGAPSCDTCNHHGCCKAIPLAAMFEAVAMLVRFHNRPGLIKRLINQGNEMHAVLGDPTADGYDQRTREWVDRDEECVLRRKGECFGYDTAPLSCRAYFVTTPAEQCCGSNQVRCWNSAQLRAHAMLADMDMLRRCTGEDLPMYWHPLGSMMDLAARLGNGEELTVIRMG